MNISRLLLITGLVYFAIKQKDVNTKNIILIVTCFLSFNILLKEGATNSPTPTPKLVPCGGKTGVKKCANRRDIRCNKKYNMKKNKPCVKIGKMCKEDSAKICRGESPSPTPTPTPSPVTVGASMTTSPPTGDCDSYDTCGDIPPQDNECCSELPGCQITNGHCCDEGLTWNTDNNACESSPPPASPDDGNSGSCIPDPAKNSDPTSELTTFCNQQSEASCGNATFPGFPTVTECSWVTSSPTPGPGTTPTPGPGTSPTPGPGTTPTPGPTPSGSSTCSSCPNGSSGWFMCFFNNCESSKCTKDDPDDEEWCLSDDSINPLGWGLLFGGVLFILIIAALIMNSGGDSAGGNMRRGRGRSLRDMVIYNQGELAGLAGK